MRKIVLLVGVVLFVSLVIVMQVSAVTVDDIIGRLEESQNSVKDMSADVVMEISIPEKTITQEMRMWSKGDKTKIKMVNTEHPMTVIMDKEKMTIKQADRLKTEDRRPKTTDLTALNGKMGDFLRNSKTNIVKEEGNEITLSVIPEEANPLMQKVDMVIDMEKGVITQQKMYSNMGVSFCKMEYEKNSDIWVLKRFTMTSSFGQMGTSTVKAEYKDVKVNKGIGDEMFK
ncbi:MAG: hypothetical protein B5M53_02070 [Candidatus Cloacimonas sp. 4484_209]|nr:MAG: hypothetical protein B5M53_02070 [Candidatus Cloacimonas sp. 4484_209]